jgi:hypothetical protein
VRTIAIALLSLAACIDEFQGSNVQIDLAETTPVQAVVGATPRTGELPNNIHFTLYAFKETADVGSLFELQRFEIHRVTDLSSPCFIDVGERVPFPGLHVSQYIPKMQEKTGITDLANPPAGATEAQKIDMATATQRYRNVVALASNDGLNAVTTASEGGYPAVAANCTDTNGIPPPMCTDDVSNARRLAACQAAWAADPNLYEGTDRVLTKPLNGTTFGYVDITYSPINLAPVGGAQFFSALTLTDVDGYALYWQYDDANHDGMPDYPASVPANERSELGVLMMFGRPTQPTRGVIHSHMVSPNPVETFFADLAVFQDLAQDDVHF